MFTESLPDSTNHGQRAWTTLASFTLQTLAGSALLLIPLLTGSVVPSLEFVHHIVAPLAEPAPVPEAARASRIAPSSSNLTITGRPIAPRAIPRFTPIIVDAGPGPPIDEYHVGVPGSTGGRDSNLAVVSTLVGWGDGTPPPLPAKPAAHAPRPVSHPMEAYLVHRVEPPYPALAKATGIRGQVVLRAIVAKDGSIENLRVMAGHPVLVKAAVEAVRQWRYRPYLLNGEAVEVETEVTVNFVLGGA